MWKFAKCYYKYLTGYHFQVRFMVDFLLLSSRVISTKVLTEDTFFSGTAMLRGHPSHAKALPFVGQRKCLHF